MLKSIDLQTKLLAAFAFFMPMCRLFNFGTIVIIILSLLFIFNIFKTNKWTIDYKIFSLIFFFFLNLFSLIYTKDVDSGLTEIVRLLSFVLLPIILLSKSHISLKEVKVISLFFIFGILIAFLFLLFNSLIVYSSDPTPLTKGFSYFTSPLKIHPSYFSTYFVFAFALYMTLFFSQTKKSVLLKYFLWILLFLFVFFIRSRAPIIIALLFFVISIFKDNSNKTMYIILIVGLLIFIFNWNYFLEFISKGRDLSMSINERLDLWKSSIEVFKNNMLFGVGIGDYQVELDKQYYLSGFDKGIDNKYNTHNQFLQTFVSTGLLGMLSLVSIFYFLIKKQLQSKSLIILFFIITVSVMMMFESIFIMLHGVYFFAFFATILFKLKTYDETV